MADDVRQLAGLLLKNYVLRHAEPFVRGEIRGAPGATQQQGAELRDYVKHQVCVREMDLVGALQKRRWPT